MTTQLVTPTDLAAELHRQLPDCVHLPGAPQYDAMRMAWNIAVDQHPAAVATPRDSAEVVAVVGAAARLGLRIAAQSTGHNAAPLVGLDEAVLVRTVAMTDVSIDPVGRTARVGGGALWRDVVSAAAPHGLAALHGSSPDVSVAGYSLGGGIGWFARLHGLATNSLTAVELVTPDGRLRRADAHVEPELFWALRGGGGNFGVVTALEFRLYPIETAYAGALVWDWDDAERVLTCWAQWATSAPDHVTTSFRLLQLPPIEAVPEPLRGRQVVMINGAVLADDQTAERTLAPLRALGPQLDMWQRVPAEALVRLHGDPEGPTPGVSDAIMLDRLPPEAISAFVTAAGPGSGSTLVAAELRQLGGALARTAAGAGALNRLAGSFITFGVAICPDAESEARGSADAGRLVEAMRPWASAHQYLNFLERPVDASRGYDPATWTRLQALRRAVDPSGTMLANHPVAG